MKYAVTKGFSPRLACILCAAIAKNERDNAARLAGDYDFKAYIRPESVAALRDELEAKNIEVLSEEVIRNREAVKVADPIDQKGLKMT
jgi:hypothetical protein